MERKEVKMAEHIKISFELMKELVKKYKIIYISKKEVILERETKEILTDKDIMFYVKFAYLWLNTVGKKWCINDPVLGYHYAYEDEKAKELFLLISNIINKVILEKKYIDTIEILAQTRDYFGEYKYAENIIIELFSNNENIDIIKSIFMVENNNKRSQVLYNYNDAMLKLKEHERLILEKQMMQSEEIKKRN